MKDLAEKTKEMNSKIGKEMHQFLKEEMKNKLTKTEITNKTP